MTPIEYLHVTDDEGYAEVISEHGLEKMPKLQEIKLLGGFDVSLKVYTVFRFWSKCILLILFKCLSIKGHALSFLC